MKLNIIASALVCVYLDTVLALDARQQAILKLIENGYQDSISKLTQEQIIDLNYFKQLVGDSEHVAVDDPTGKIPDKVFTKRIAQLLNLKGGPYFDKLIREENQDKFVNDYIRYLAGPCEKLRTSFKLSMALYYLNIDDKDFVQSAKQNKRSYNLLETAGVCQALLKFTDSICLKSYKYLVDKKMSKQKTLFERIRHFSKKIRLSRR